MSTREYTRERSSSYATGPVCTALDVTGIFVFTRIVVTLIGCTRSYTQNSHLRRHKLVHTEEKPFACDWPNCNYRSVRSCDVANHRVTHTGEKRFVCEVIGCEKAFTRGHHLRRHMLTNHSIETYEENPEADEEVIAATDEIIEEDQPEEEQ